jgi:phosphate:Na+ symporter
MAPGRRQVLAGPQGQLGIVPDHARGDDAGRVFYGKVRLGKMISLLLGGIGLFLLGMWMMTEGLKLAAGGALQTVLRLSTSSSWRGLAAGVLITAIVQSSSAVTIATIGFVNAGLLDLTRSVWVIFGTNLGTTMTGWLVAVIGVKIEPGPLALPLLGGGMLLRLALGARPRLAGLGQALAGFGAFFLGIGFLQQGFAETTVPPELFELGLSPWTGIPVFLLVGVLLTILTQSSSAAVAVVLTAGAGAGVPLELAAAAVIGTNIGTTSTAVLAAISATPPAKRVAGAHIAFNVLTAGAAIILFGPLVAISGVLASLLGGPEDTALTLAVFHSLFNALGLLLVWPISGRLVAWLGRRFVSLDEEIGRPKHLDATLLQVPQLALRGLVLESARMSEFAYEIARASMGGAPGQPGLLARKHAGVLALGGAIRGFIGQMNEGALPGEVADAIPDIIRGIQHLEELANISIEIAATPVGFDRYPGAAEIAEMRRLVGVTLAANDLEAEDPAGDAQLAEEVEATYQALKAELLRLVALGRLAVATMEAMLLLVQRMRRGAEAARKARRRLGPWLRRQQAADKGQTSAAPVAPALEAQP